jgi:hypothetical protein
MNTMTPFREYEMRARQEELLRAAQTARRRRRDRPSQARGAISRRLRRSRPTA